ncbi:MAG TPA: alcohol dehydrogenase catalytic domain-containing protein [Solirubrobacteraceae bacterium]|nr:alcohol dehydrogenase catalytic domain-containing protein [Solirubrobacteraceae bacterium]
MRAAVYRGPGELRIEQVPEPADPGPGEIVIAVRRAAICGTDSSEWAHGPLLAVPPVILGHEFTGVVAATGPEVSGLAVGDRVVCGSGISCGECEWCRAGRTNLCARYRTIGLHVDGGLAEYVSAPARICLPVPDAVSDDAAAIAQPLAVALHAVRRSGVRAGQSCAVIGVGGIGAFIVAGAVAAGAVPLAALDVDPERLRTAERLGATVALDARGRAIDEVIHEAVGPDGADVVIEASGVPSAPAAAIAAAKRGGRVLIVGLQSAPRELDLLAMAVREVELSTTLAHICDVDLPEALALLGAGELAAAVTDRVIALEDLVEEGIRPLAAGAVSGKIVVAP